MDTHVHFRAENSILKKNELYNLKVFLNYTRLIIKCYPCLLTLFVQKLFFTSSLFVVECIQISWICYIYLFSKFLQWSGAHLYWHLRKFPLIRWQLSLLFKMGCRSLQAAWKFDRAENIRNLLDWPVEMLKVLLDKIFTRRRRDKKK